MRAVAPASLNTRRRLASSWNAAVSARLAEAGRVSTQSRSPSALRCFTIRRDRPVTSATGWAPKRCRDLVEGAVHGRQGRQVLDHTLPPLQRLAGLNGLA